mmetsp:Transcript_133307/g.414517  ORF Transcript_133307/g.414517 Transcript_133307/m.414517 type:complete len:241 (-) Transcript_133307:74-796(-)
MPPDVLVALWNPIHRLPILPLPQLCPGQGRCGDRAAHADQLLLAPGHVGARHRLPSAGVEAYAGAGDTGRGDLRGRHAVQARHGSSRARRLLRRDLARCPGRPSGVLLLGLLLRGREALCQAGCALGGAAPHDLRGPCLPGRQVHCGRGEPRAPAAGPRRPPLRALASVLFGRARVLLPLRLGRRLQEGPHARAHGLRLPQPAPGHRPQSPPPGRAPLGRGGRRLRGARPMLRPGQPLCW